MSEKKKDAVNEEQKSESQADKKKEPVRIAQARKEDEGTEGEVETSKMLEDDEPKVK